MYICNLKTTHSRAILCFPNKTLFLCLGVFGSLPLASSACEYWVPQAWLSTCQCVSSHRQAAASPPALGSQCLGNAESSCPVSPHALLLFTPPAFPSSVCLSLFALAGHVSTFSVWVPTRSLTLTRRWPAWPFQLLNPKVAAGDSLAPSHVSILFLWFEVSPSSDYVLLKDCKQPLPCFWTLLRSSAPSQAACWMHDECRWAFRERKGPTSERCPRNESLFSILRESLCQGLFGLWKQEQLWCKWTLKIAIIR